MNLFITTIKSLVPVKVVSRFYLIIYFFLFLSCKYTKKENTPCDFRDKINSISANYEIGDKIAQIIDSVVENDTIYLKNEPYLRYSYIISIVNLKSSSNFIQISRAYPYSYEALQGLSTYKENLIFVYDEKILVDKYQFFTKNKTTLDTTKLIFDCVEEKKKEYGHFDSTNYYYRITKDSKLEFVGNHL